MVEEMVSVGIDIGTSTTQLVLSKLHVKNTASSVSIPKMEIVAKHVFYKSTIIFTPVHEKTNKIDGEKLQQFVLEQFERAGIRKREIHTGAVIITGETARKENANEVLGKLSEFAGDFVVATAGPDLESIIAGKGAGAHTYSRVHSTSVVNLDIGGGTTNLAVFTDGEVQDTGCLDIGGRLIKVDKISKEITYIAPKIQELIHDKGLHIKVGDIVTAETLMPVVNEMVKVLEEAVGLRPQSLAYEKIVTHKGLKSVDGVCCLSFTGGVADGVYEEDKVTADPFQYGDIGILLGKAIGNSSLVRSFTLLRPEETIQATVVGAGSHTTEVSGSTITYTTNTFPLKNLPIVKIPLEEEQEHLHDLGARLAERISWFRVEDDLQPLAIAIHGKVSPSFRDVGVYADQLLEGMEELRSRGFPTVIIVEEDMGKVLGQSIFAKAKGLNDLLCLDGIKVDNGDYIDIGRPIGDGRVLPVVIKTLVFH
ncbi:MAG: ethanolamine ammonia-lyase reactivating factor EutA [Bacillus sp. (in: Bacteria)]|nr:ethanolamine ammonia-lyase reactivating factor EutA [Bacillus sp. (in: firmicutes)]